MCHKNVFMDKEMRVSFRYKHPLLNFLNKKAMDYMHNHLKIIHRDLKAANIFLVQNGSNIEIKIGDFGHALNKVNNFAKENFSLGTLQWMVI